LHYKDQNFAVQNENEIAKYFQIEPISDSQVYTFLCKITHGRSDFLLSRFRDDSLLFAMLRWPTQADEVRHVLTLYVSIIETALPVL
jgi:hypothetical protein